MIKFEKKILQFGFGAVGRSFYEKVRKEIRFDENKYFVISRDKNEFKDYINMGGLVSNFILQDVNKDNFKEVFEKYIGQEDFLIDFADTVGTKDILMWCADNNIMYLNTGEADWPDNWYSIFDENEKKSRLREEYKNDKNKNLVPIVLQHGNNPGLVSHFVKAGIEYIVKKQIKNNKYLKKLINENKWGEVAQEIGLQMIHVNDIDLQKLNENYNPKVLYNTWCIDSFFFEILSESTINFGTHEKLNFENDFKYIDRDKGYLELKNIAVNTKCKTYYPGGKFEGFMVPHEETITIAKWLEVKSEDKTSYRPTVVFLYSPCEYAKRYMLDSKVNEYPDIDENKPLDGNNIVRGHIYPEKTQIAYSEKIESGTEYVGVLLLGKNFKPVWVGNRVEMNFLYKNKKNSYWQTPTITPVSMSALSATVWMIKNKDKGGIYFPEDINEYKDIIKLAEKYISKTIYKTFSSEEIEKSLNIDLSNIQIEDFFEK